MPEVDPSATADGTDPAQVRLMTVVEGAGLRCPTQAPDSAAGLGRGQYRPR